MAVRAAGYGAAVAPMSPGAGAHVLLPPGIRETDLERLALEREVLDTADRLVRDRQRRAPQAWPGSGEIQAAATATATADADGVSHDDMLQIESEAAALLAAGAHAATSSPSPPGMASADPGDHAGMPPLPVPPLDLDRALQDLLQPGQDEADEGVVVLGGAARVTHTQDTAREEGGRRPN